MTQAGRKDDDGKIWAATVLAGFRDVLAVPSNAALIADVEDESEHEMIRAAIDLFLETALSIDERLTQAARQLMLCPTAIRGACEVGSYGARKYERDNWLYVPDGISRYYEAGGRHILDMLCGEPIDAVERGGSGLPNLSHVCWNIFAGATLVARERAKADK